MRLLSVGNRYPPWSLGGYETIWQRATHHLRRAGHEVRVLTTLPDPTDASTEATAEPDVHRELRWYWRAHEFPPMSLVESVALERENARVLRRHLEQLRPHAVLWWAMGGMSLSLLELVRRSSTPALGLVGDEWLLYGPEVDGWTRRWRGWRRPAAPAAAGLARVPARVVLDRAARWIFISDHLRAVSRTGGLRLRDSTVLHPGVDPVRFAAQASAQWRWRLLYCGRIEPRKGVATAVEALAHLPPQAGLVLDGDGPADYRAGLGELARRIGVSERVSFRRSARDEVPGAYAAADAVVFPVVWQEPWGLVPLEAMSVGRPVVASRAGGGPAEYLREDSNCLSFPPGDAAALGRELRRLAGDPALRARLVEQGRLTAAALGEPAFHAGLDGELERLIRPR